MSWACLKIEAGVKIGVLAKSSARSSVRRHLLRPILQGGKSPGLPRWDSVRVGPGQVGRQGTTVRYWFAKGSKAVVGLDT